MHLRYSLTPKYHENLSGPNRNMNNWVQKITNQEYRVLSSLYFLFGILIYWLGIECLFPLNWNTPSQEEQRIAKFI